MSKKDSLRSEYTSWTDLQIRQIEYQLSLNAQVKAVIAWIHQIKPALMDQFIYPNFFKLSLHPDYLYFLWGLWLFFKLILICIFYSILLSLIHSLIVIIWLLLLISKSSNLRLHNQIFLIYSKYEILERIMKT